KQFSLSCSVNIFNQINPNVRMRMLLTVALSLSLLSLNAQTKSGQKTPPLSEANPTTVDISAERLTWMDNILQESVGNDDICDVDALIARNRKIVYHKAIGMPDPQHNRAQKTDDIFRNATPTTAITPAAVMML